MPRALYGGGDRFTLCFSSLRAQKKFTYAVSATMWLLAFFCVLPSIVNRELATGRSAEINSINLTNNEDAVNQLM